MSLPGHVPDALQPLFAGLAQSPDAVFVTDRHNRIVCWNTAAEHLLGYPAEEVLSAACGPLLQGCDVFGNRYCSDQCPVVQIAGRGQAVRQFDLQLRTRDGRTVTVDVSILTLVAGTPDNVYLAHVLRPSARPAAATPSSTSPPEDGAPRDQLSAARQSLDARARRLTPREVEILAMMAAGRTTPEIADRLHIAPLTVRNHVQNILDKLEVHSKAEAVAFAFQKHLL